MGCWDATCLASNLAITAGASIRLIFLERKLNADFQYVLPTSAWQVVSLPVRGQYNEYGGIAEVDNTSPQARLLLNLAKKLFGQAQEFTSVELLADKIWEQPRFLYYTNLASPSLNGLECWPDTTNYDYDATGKYGPVYACGRDKAGNLLAGYRLREFGYALVLEEVYQAMVFAAEKTYRLKVQRIYDEAKRAITARRELLALAASLVPTTLPAIAVPQIPTGEPSSSLATDQALDPVKLVAYQEKYFNWRRNFIPTFSDWFSELEVLLLTETVPTAGTAEQASLGYSFAQFQVFNEAMAIGRRHYSPQSCGEQHGWLQEYRFHQLLGKQIMGILDNRIAEITNAETEEAIEEVTEEEDSDY